MPTAGDVPEVCANEGIAIRPANTIVIKDMCVFMKRILPTIHHSWQATFEPLEFSFEFVRNCLYDDATVADECVYAEIDARAC